MSDRTSRSRARLRRPRRSDRGFTLVELLIVVTLMGLVVTVLSSAIIVILRTAPTTELRIDDARSTRGLATWLSHDVASTPPFDITPPSDDGTPLPQIGQGGFNLATTANTCTAPDGTTLVELTWVQYDRTLERDRTFVATYRAESDGSGPTSVRRYTCSDSDSFSTRTRVNLTSDLAPVTPDMVKLVKSEGTDGVVEILKFDLTGQSGETVLVNISSRNPSEFFE